MDYNVLNTQPIILSNLHVQTDELLTALLNTNKLLYKIYSETEKLKLNIFEVIDFRVFSGMIGEIFSQELESLNNKLIKNPFISGYPDLLQVSTPEMIQFYETCTNDDLLYFKFGGIEVKNTFGTKKSGKDILMGEERIYGINKKLDWKAHHRNTNYLIGLLSDYVGGVPQIVALCYCDNLCIDDWNKKQNPKEGSAMTSFSAISNTGYNKMKNGLKICINKKDYLNFFK